MNLGIAIRKRNYHHKPIQIEVIREIITNLMSIKKLTKDDVNKIKNAIAKKNGLSRVPSNSELIEHLQPSERGIILDVLSRKAVRTASGIIIIAVMSTPRPCPQSEPCAYCPGGPSKGFPQSYTGHEPAAMRGLQNDYDPYRQVKHRIAQYKSIGHIVDKVELIVMGGTFPSAPLEYQRFFIKECIDAIIEKKSKSLAEAKRLAENSSIHNVGITVETRPDWAKELHVDRMLSMGITRTELGVQNVYNDIYKKINREHTVSDVTEATQILKDSGLKVVYHMMPGLPGSNIEKDFNGFCRILSDPLFRPDMLKIYPCLVIKGTKIYEWWKKGTYKPYSIEETIELIMEIKKILPEWIRLMRVQRDIPSNLIVSGVKKSNLRELVLNRLSEEGSKCNCIRCREVGLRWLKERIKPNPQNIEMITNQYDASKGTELFISYEDPVNKILIGYLRLRIPSNKPHRPEIFQQKAALIRELRVCGPMLPVNTHKKTFFQHKGIGKDLLSKAENLANEYDCEKIIVTSALGTKLYYKQLDYKYDGPYMSKNLIK